jgi:hypothetical protein
MLLYSTWGGVLEGGAKPLAGDDLSAIWVPLADPVIQSRTLLPSSTYSDRAELRREVWHDNLEDDEELAKHLFGRDPMRGSA